MTHIVLIGGSVTFGHGVSDIDSICCSFLRDILRNMDKGINCEISNASVPGYSSYNGRMFVENYLEKIDADILLIAFGWNDIAHDFVNDKTEGKSWVIYDISYKGVMIYSRTIQYIHKFGRRLNRPSKTIATNWKRSEFPLRVPPEDFRENMIEMVKHCRDLKVEPVFVSLPRQRSSKTLERRMQLFDKYMDILRDLSSELNVHLADVDQVFQQFPSLEFFPNPEVDFSHPNPEGQRLMAEVIASTLDTAGLLILK